MTFAVSVMVRLKLLYCSVLSSLRSQGQDIKLCVLKWSRLCLQCVPSCQETKTTVKIFDPDLFFLTVISFMITVPMGVTSPCTFT